MNDDGYPMRELVNLNCIWHRVIEKQMADLGLTSIQSRMLGYVYFQCSRKRKVFQKELEEAFKIRKYRFWRRRGWCGVSGCPPMPGKRSWY